MKKINTELWEYTNGFTYPEDEIKSVFKRNRDGETFGIAFSGGGTRSASAVNGQLKGLKEIGLLNHVKYISAVSGGGWAAVPFMFLPQGMHENDFFGPHPNPEKLAKSFIENISHLSLLHIISESEIAGKFTKNAFKGAGDETYSRVLGDIFLEPFGLNDLDKFFTHDQETLNRAKKINPALQNSDFYKTAKNRPFLILGATILDHEWFAKTNKYPIEYTPFYVGVRKFFPSNEPVGGGYINSFAYDSREPKIANPENKPVEVKLGSSRHKFTLSDMIGSTGAAPQEMLDKFYLRFLGFPEFRHWAVHTEKGSHTYYDYNEFAHGDGGFLEYLGIMPLLSRKVNNIIVFINGKTPFKYNVENPLESEIGVSTKALFIAHKGFNKNIVLNGGDNAYQEILDNFAKRQQHGKTLMFCREYQVIDNDFYAIKKYESVKICWIYNNRVNEWTKNLHPDYRFKIGKKGDFYNFPNYDTFFENFGKTIDLTKEQVVLLSNLSYWNVKNNKSTLIDFFGPKFFEKA
ncbi:MAG: hypothetical protein ACE5DO_07265 [Desulfobacterales bacterium]